MAHDEEPTPFDNLFDPSHEDLSGGDLPAPLPAPQLPDGNAQPPQAGHDLDLSEEEAHALGMGEPTGPRTVKKPKLRLQGEGVDGDPRLSDLMRPDEQDLGKVDSAPRPSGTIPLLERRAPRAILGDAAALFAATRHGRASEVRNILQNGVDPNLNDDPGQEHIEAIRFLSQNEDIGQQHVDGMKLGRTACHMAAARGHSDVLGILLQHKIDVNAVDHAGKTPLMLASFGGFRPLGRMLIEAGARVDSTDLRGGTALLAAARGGHEEMVQDLLQAGAPVDAADITGSTPLLAAAAGVHGKVLLALLVAGPDITRVDGTGLTALSLLVNAVEPSQAGAQSFVAVPEDRILPLVKLLLRAGARNVPDATGVLPSDHARGRGYEATAVLLEQHTHGLRCQPQRGGLLGDTVDQVRYRRSDQWRMQ